MKLAPTPVYEQAKKIGKRGPFPPLYKYKAKRIVHQVHVLEKTEKKKAAWSREKECPNRPMNGTRTLLKKKIDLRSNIVQRYFAFSAVCTYHLSGTPFFEKYQLALCRSYLSISEFLSNLEIFFYIWEIL